MRLYFFKKVLYNNHMLIQLKNLSKRFDQKVIFENVNLEIEAGQVVLLTGNSGSGKSTLLNIIGGLERPTTGEIFINNRDILKLKGRERADFYRRQIGFIFQDFYLHPQLKVSENIALAGTFANLKSAETKHKVEFIAKTLHIDSILNYKLDQVSGGQAERICIARALFMSPKIVLADEPTNNLDPTNAENVIKILRAIATSMKITVIISSHSQMVANYADRIINISQGAIHEISQTR